MPVSPEFRQQVESLYHSALQIDPDKRPAFLDEACGLNSSLRQEVESLLTTHDLTKDSSHSASSEVATQILGEKPGSLIGQSIAHYKILSLLGQGGMGEVYLARDTKLGRNVALKLLPKSLHADEERLKRFAREARSASALNHPNVCVIHEIGETADGQSFIAMEFIEGITLRQRLRQGPIQLNDAVSIAQQIAAALTGAHKAGVVHRDIKPENIMLRPDGYVKVLDFGLAKLTEKYAFPSDSEAETFPVFDTQPDHLIGTVNYLSPEQAKRRPIDERTDIWSLGVVLYEMLSGHMPFQGETASHTIVAILEHEPEPLTKSLGAIPVTLDRIVNKALKKSVIDRYRTVSDFSSDLQQLKRELSTGSVETRRRLRFQLSRPAARAAFAILGLLVVAGVMYVLTGNRQPAPEPPVTSINSVAVLPFVNMSNNPDLEYLSDGMTESLINSLSQLPNVKVSGRYSAFLYKGVQKDTQTIARELGVHAILTGRVVNRDGHISISVDLEDARDKHHIWGEQYNRSTSDLLAIQDELSHKITEKLRLKMNGSQEQRRAKRPTENVEAYQLYLKGRWYWNKFTKEDKVQAINAFEQAIKLDPNYGLAYAGLADVYVNDSSVPLRQSYKKAKDAAEKALELDSSLGEAHATLGFIKTFYDIDWAGAEAEFQGAIGLSPNYSTAHYYYANFFMARGNYDQALQEFEKARQIDPLSPVINAEIGSVYFYQRDYDRCIEFSNRMAKQFPEFFLPRVNLAWAYTQKKMFREAMAEYGQAEKLSKGHTFVMASRAYTYAVSGKKAEARKILNDLEARAKREHVSPMRFVLVYLGLGNKDQMFNWLERAREELDVFLVTIRVNPFFDSVRGDPRFQDFIQKIGLASR